MKRVIVLIGALLLTGCVTTDSSVKQDSSATQDSCAMVYSNEIGTSETGKLTKKASPVSVTININKNRLYMGEYLEGIDCKPHKSAAFWNCPEPNGMTFVGFFDDKTATYRKVYNNNGSVLEFIKPRWKPISCPE
jgi:hypothetical protein